jgi:hypothetical protein
MEEITTTDLAQFGHREKAMAADLLKAMGKGLPEDFYEDGVTVMMNKNSGNVFLTNSDYQVAMMNGGKLESFYSCPECGHEGFFEDMKHENEASGDPVNQSKECKRYYKDIKAGRKVA